jgi:iron complex transport system substrate-binding protein
MLAVALWAAAGVWSLTPALADQPARVVSINLCTDQLAMLLADPGQLVSVTHLASDPLASSMVAEAAGYQVNRGQAEQVFLMRPDLVLAGTYTPAGTVDLLRRLGIAVVQVAPVAALADVPSQIRVVGAAMGQGARAEAMAQHFEAEVAALRVAGPQATAAFYYPNGYTTGAGTLADEVLGLTGFSNLGAAAGVTGGGILPLERLVIAAPQVLVTSTPYPGASRSEEILQHPALAAVSGAARVPSDADWVCGTPHLLRAIRGMALVRAGLGPGA